MSYVVVFEFPDGHDDLQLDEVPVPAEGALVHIDGRPYTVKKVEVSYRTDQSEISMAIVQLNEFLDEH
jgi:hypothetical protein